MKERLAQRNRVAAECPWSTTDGACLTADCAEHGPIYRISRSHAARVMAAIRSMIDLGRLIPGERLAVSYDSRFVALCPRAWTEPLSELLIRDAIGPRVSLEIDGRTAYVRVLVADGDG